MRIDATRIGLSLVGALVVLLPLTACADGAVIVNGAALDPATSRQLETRYGLQVAPGRYWYDATSGLWGLEGGPARGQVVPGVRVGAPLRADASGGRTPVFVNGRSLHPTEVAGLQQLFGVVQPGRYWLDARGVGGREGGPAQFDLHAAARSRGGRSIFGHSLTGSVIGDDSVVGYIHGGVGVTCGPDGGCIY